MGVLLANDDIVKLSKSAAAIEASPLLGRLEKAGLPEWSALAGTLLLIAGGIGWAAAAAALSAPLPARIQLPEVPGWQRVDYAPQAPWQPLAGGADHRLLGRYQDAAGNQVDVFYSLYASQGEGKEAGGFGQGALTPDSGWSWTSAGPATATAKSERLMAGGKIERLALTWYRSGDLLSGSNAKLKLANIGDRLLLRAQPTAMLILSAEQRPGFDAAKELTAFQAAIGDPGPWMDRIAEAR